MSPYTVNAATIGGVPISVRDVDQAAGGRLLALCAQEYMVRRRTLEEQIDRKLLENEAQRRRLTVGELLRIVVDGTVGSASAGETNHTRARAERRREYRKGLRAARVCFRR